MRQRTILTLGACATLALAGAQADAFAHPTNARAHPVVTVKRLVSDQAGVARMTDPDLVNAWGMSHPPGGPLWVSDNGTNVSTLYTGAITGTPIAKVPLVVKIPGGAPTGQVFNGTKGFTVPHTGMPALFIFAGEDGDITAWNGDVHPMTSAVTVARVPNAVFKGIALVRTMFGPRLLVTNFHAGRIDVFNSSFHRIPTRRFTDPRLPAGYAPFNVAVFHHRVYVTYAKQDADRHDDVAGPGHGFIDVFGARGRFLHRLVSRGMLNSPWGMVIAPPTFGAFAGKLMVGNFGNGRIHVYGLLTGRLFGTVINAKHHAVRIDGLWGLIRGDAMAGGHNAVWFSAGPDGESHGLLGVLRAG